MQERFDLIIIGAGPAGMTAGVYAARKKLKTLILTKDIGGQAAWSSDVENYLGFTMVTGADLVAKFERHLEEFKDDVTLHLLNGGVVRVACNDDEIEVTASDNQKFRARALIITSGKKPRELGVPGEKELLNRGVTYCAWCDGPLFKGKDVVIVGGGNSALDAALNVQKLVHEIYIVNVAKELTADPVMVEKVKAADNIRIINQAELKQIEGDKAVIGVKILDHDSGLEKDIPCQGVFIEVGYIPATDYLKGTIDLNDQGEIVIDTHNATSLAGVFAAGDVTTVAEKQIIIAVGEGAKAAIAAAQYLAKS
ncbi:FAD-dependent oxidoreductase [bacterium]|nr:FAD-dependent oxidoreductase [bacterium]